MYSYSKKPGSNFDKLDHAGCTFNQDQTFINEFKVVKVLVKEKQE